MGRIWQLVALHDYTTYSRLQCEWDVWQRELRLHISTDRYIYIGVEYG